MPCLVTHQIKVAGVAKLICDNFQTDLDTETIILACLLHDMGNIVKFKLGYFPEFTEPEGLEYWQEVQDEFIKKYGKDEHYATDMINKEISIDQKVIDLVNSINFKSAKENMLSDNFAVKICAYADMRVTPMGVVTLNERFLDIKNRYQVEEAKKSTLINSKSDYSFDPQKESSDLFEMYLTEIEKQIFEKCIIKPEYINDKAVTENVELLKKYKV